MIPGTPRPSSPTSPARAPWNSTSLEALLWFPSLFFSRRTLIAFRVPSGSQRGSRKQLRPPGAWASTKNASHCGAEQNHLWPCSAYSVPPPPPANGSARVVLARTSEPPWRSVMAMPNKTPRFSCAGIWRGS